MPRMALVVVVSAVLGAAAMRWVQTPRPRPNPEPPSAWVQPAALLPLPPLDDPAIQLAAGQEPAATMPPATAPATSTPAAAPDVNAAADEERRLQSQPIQITRVLDGEDADALEWPVGKRLRLRSTKLRLSFRLPEPNAGVTFKVVSADGMGEAPFAAVGDSVTINLAHEKLSGRSEFVITATRPNVKNANALVPVPVLLGESATPEADLRATVASAPAASLNRFFEGRYQTPGTPVNGTTPVPIFDEYLRAELKQGGENREYEVYLFDAVDAKVRKLLATGSISDRTTVGGVVSFRVRWDKTPPAKSDLLLLVRERDRDDTKSHNFAAAVVTVAKTPTLPTVAVSDPRPTADSNYTPKVQGGYALLGTGKIKVQVKAPAAGVTKARTRLLLYVDRNPKDPVNAPNKVVPLDDAAVRETGGNFVYEFEPDDLSGDGDHVVSGLLEAGGATSEDQKLLNVRVRRGGFAVSRVSPTDFSTTTDNRIRVIFTPARPVDAGTLPSNFLLNLETEAGDPNKTKLSGPPVLEVGSNTVVLQVNGTLPAGQYVLTVKAAVKDVYGNPLNGTYGDDAGGESTFSIVQPVGGLQPSVPAAGGMAAVSGPNVEYKEFEPRKFFANGFNPADRVETRVVRLYYYRDAPRVVQIVNRDARAYNAPAVDVRRRAADFARDKANETTDERKRLEDVAVRAAADARAAEARVRDLQGRQATARTQAAVANNQLSQRLLQLDAAQRTLDRDTTTLNTQRAVDASTDAARRRKEQLALEVDQLQQVLAITPEVKATAPEAVDGLIRTAQQNAASKQRELAAAFNTAKANAEAVPNSPAAAAKAEIESIELQMKRATPQRFAVLNQQLVLAKQKQAEVLQAAIVTNTALSGPVEKATRDADEAQLKLEQLAAAQRALRDLPQKQQNLREAEIELSRATASAAGRNAVDPLADASQDAVSATQAEIRKLQQAAANAAAVEDGLRADVSAAVAAVQEKRIKEVEAAQAAGSLERQELRASQEQFRREVAAATENPDVYAPGKPGSDDPVRQCSLSVIGEGLIQIRGPVKGVNVIRMMINQIDAPVGQVRIGVHTVQVNGERVDRMNKVVANIQRYLDHARFVTVQSTQILRKAITSVAARKAEEAAATLPPNCPQADRDQKYLYSFFGRDFVDELRQLDSEFLRTGNKLLSLHSMDSTSLAAAMSLLALAKNDVRLEILTEFEAQIQSRLPAAEAAFYQEGLACANKCEACLDKKFCVLSANARFETFRSYFNAEIQASDTLTPAQREFIKLAQIFKTRLVTELELKQRVVERSLLEDRLGDYLAELQAAKRKEDLATAALDGVRVERQNAVTSLVTVLTQKFVDILSEVGTDVDTAVGEFQGFEQDAANATPGRVKMLDDDAAGPRRGQRSITLAVEHGSDPAKDLFVITGAGVTVDQFKGALKTFGKFRYTSTAAVAALKELRALEAQVEVKDGRLVLTRQQINDISDWFRTLHRAVKDQLTAVNLHLAGIIAKLQEPAGTAKATDVYAAYLKLVGDAAGRIVDAGMLGEVDKARKRVDRQFANLLRVEAGLSQATLAARLARRSLDEKKLLDMLIDDMEEKYIELLDGTRAHTANYDNYLKALSTALDDDFNTQFYQPAFRKIRTLGAGWDVALGQIESTTVLANNRAFAKVSPAASMEFDLPKRDIFIKEAMKGAKAAVDEYGALLNDPTFLAITKLYSGTPTAAQMGSGGGLSAVRNVLPGLPSSADEILMAQAGPNRREFGSAFEALIPDPAVYKFETGTGYEVRPVMSPDGQAVVFNFDYMYTTDVREPVRADEKHLGRVKRHFVHTDVQLTNYEMREVSKYWVTLKAARTGRGVQLLQDVPGVGVLFRPLPSASSSLQQNLIYAQTTLFPTLFDLMGLRYAPTIADIDPEFTKNDEFVVRGRRDYLRQFIFDYGASRVDDALRILHGERRTDLYRSQHTIPHEHPNGYRGPGMRLRDGHLQEGYDPLEAYPATQFNRGLHTPLPSAPPGGGWDVPPPGVALPPGVDPLPPNAVPLPGVVGSSALPFQKESQTAPPATRDFTARPLGTTVTREGDPRNLAPLPTPRSVVAPGSYPVAPPIPPPPQPVGPGN